MSEKSTPGEWADYITCPHCGKVDKDRTEYLSGLRGDGSWAFWDCPRCGVMSEVEMAATYSFRAHPYVRPEIIS